MAMQAPSFVTTLRDQVMADKKKSAVMAVLLLILIGSMSRLFIGGEQQPSTLPATAAASAVPNMAPTPQPIPRAPSAAPDASARSAPSVVDQPAGRDEPKILATNLPRSIDRDLFISAAFSTFASAPGAAGETGDSPSSFWDAILTRMAGRQNLLLKERDAVDYEIASLRLQSTLTGPCPLAYISGRLVREGDEFRGFSVVRIEDRRVMLRKSVFTRPLIMP